MSSSTQDNVQGRAKEATGAVTGDDELKHEGQKEQMAGKVKENVGNAVDKTKETFSNDDKDDHH